jgi:hypothetical protein
MFIHRQSAIARCSKSRQTPLCSLNASQAVLVSEDVRNQMLCDCGRCHRLLVLSPSPGESVQIDPRPLETAVLFRNSGYPTEIPGPLPGVLQLNVAAPNFQWCPTAPESETPLRLISSVFHSEPKAVCKLPKLSRYIDRGTEEFVVSRSGTRISDAGE